LLNILLSRIVVIASDIIYGLGVCLISELFAVCFGRSFVFVYQPSLRRERDAKTGGNLRLLYMYFIKQKLLFSLVTGKFRDINHQPYQIPAVPDSTLLFFNNKIKLIPMESFYVLFLISYLITYVEIGHVKHCVVYLRGSGKIF
jgi:hypothetical protein